VRFSGLAGVTYQIETRAMRDGADTYLEVRNAGLAVVASSDNVGTRARAEQRLRGPALEHELGAAGHAGHLRDGASLGRRPVRHHVPPRQLRPPDQGDERAATYPNVTTSPLFFSITLNQNTQTTRNLVVGNTGTVDLLDYNLVEAGGGIPWVTAAPIANTVPPGENRTSVVTFDATGLAVGNYSGTLEVHSNDPDNAVRNVALILRVDPGTTGVGEAPVAAANWLGANKPNPCTRGPPFASRSARRAGPPRNL